MPIYLFDASALCKRYFVNETGADVVEALFQDPTSPRYLINLAIAEILNAIYRVHREGHLTAEEREDFIAAFYTDIATGRIEVYSIRDDHIFGCESIIEALQHMPVSKKRPGPIDALLIACGRAFDADDLILVSSDVDLNTLAQQFGLATLDPEHTASQ
jgi:hypothetical protein